MVTWKEFSSGRLQALQKGFGVQWNICKRVVSHINPHPSDADSHRPCAGECPTDLLVRPSVREVCAPSARPRDVATLSRRNDLLGKDRPHFRFLRPEKSVFELSLFPPKAAVLVSLPILYWLTTILQILEY